MKKIKKENGVLVLEYTVIFIMVLFILIGFISLGFVFYQQALLNTIATEVATEVASNYKWSARDFGSETLKSSDFTKTKMLRGSLSMFSMKAAHRTRAEGYIPDRLKMTSFGLNSSDPVVDELSFEMDNIGRMHVVVTISLECDVLFSGALKYLGIINEKPKFTATARAECTDLTSYAGQVAYFRYIEEKISENLTSVDSIAQSIGTIKGVIERVFS